MNVMVSGATGFLGNALCSVLESQGHQIIKVNTKSADLRYSVSLNQFSDIQFDYIYHLAAWTQAGDFCLHHAGEQWILNQQINTNMLAWWQKNQAQAKLICIGTSCSYAPDYPLSEDNYLEGTPIDSLYTYAMTKRMMLVGLKALSTQFGLRYLCLVPSTLYGPGYHTDDRQMHFIFDLIRKIIRGKQHGEPVELWGDGTQRRELVYVEDFVRLTLSLAQKVDNDVINIGAGEEFEIKEFARMICEIVDYDPEEIIYNTSRYVGARSKCLEIDKLKLYCEDLRLTPLQTGLRNTIDWFLSKDTLFMEGQCK